MKTVLDVIFVVLWVAISLAIVSAVSRYRRTRAHVGGLVDRNEYRADRDWALRVIVLCIGVLSVVVIYTITHLLG